LRQRLGRDADVRLAVQQQPRDLLRRALLQVQADIRVVGAEVAHGRRQGIAGLAVRGGNAQAAAAGLREIVGCALEVVGLLQQALDDRQHLLSGLRQPREALAYAHEQFDAQLLLQLADLAAHAGLRGVQRMCDLGQVEAAALGLADGAELLEVHARRFCEAWGWLSSTDSPYRYAVRRGVC
jgi:hypothetical protein